MANNEGRSHCEMAHEISAMIRQHDQQSPLADAGALYRYDRRSGLWVRHDLDAVARFVGNAINEKNCKRIADYRGIAQLVYSNARDGIAHDASPFDAAPPGIAADGMFYWMNASGVESATLRPDHLARFAVPVAPNARHPKPLFDVLVAASFPDTDEDYREQRALLQQHFGACVSGAAARMQKAMIWRGVERSGKSTLQEIMRSMFKFENVAAVPPHLWHHEYHCAALANIILNTVGEIDDKRPLSVSFKNVIGRDLLHGRHVTHRPFSFRNEAGHVFNCNGFPPTEDQTNAFWDRWSGIEFRYTRPPEKRDDRLAEKIIAAELPAVLAWALEGAKLLGQNRGRFIETAAHLAMMEKWRGRTDSVRSWLLDREAVELLRDHVDARYPSDYWLRTQTELHRAYCGWCQSARRHSLGLHNFGDALRNAFAMAGLCEDRTTHKVSGAHPLDLNLSRL
jgi:putative DNA primase/helicase